MFSRPQDYTDSHENINDTNLISVHYRLLYPISIQISCVNLVESRGFLNLLYKYVLSNKPNKFRVLLLYPNLLGSVIYVPNFINNNGVASPKGRDVKIKGGLCMGNEGKNKKI